MSLDIFSLIAAPKPALGAHWFQTTVTYIKEIVVDRDKK